MKKLLDKHIHFGNRRAACSKKYDRFLRGETNCSHDLRAFPCNQRVVKRYKDSQICSVYVCRRTTSKISTFDGDQASLSASDMPSDVILERLYKSKLQDSVQLQTVLALYDPETVQNNGQTRYLRLKTSVKLHIDQNDENSKLQSPERSCGKRSSHQESKRKFCLR